MRAAPGLERGAGEMFAGAACEHRQATGGFFFHRVCDGEAGLFNLVAHFANVWAECRATVNDNRPHLPATQLSQQSVGGSGDDLVVEGAHARSLHLQALA